MAISLTDGTVTVNLPDDLLWSDEHSWSPVEQSVATSIAGAALIDVAVRVNGRPITLEGDEEHAWLLYSVVDQLKAWAAAPGKQLLLTLRSTTFDVVFRHQDAPAIEVTPVVDFNAPDAQDFFYGALKFMEI